MAKTFGLDLGTANTIICKRGEGIILRAPSVIVVENTKERDVYALGMQAKNMLGKTPEGLCAFRPLKGGVIAEYDAASKMIRGFLEAVGAFSIFSRPDIIVCHPYMATDVEQRALSNAVFEAGARRVGSIEEPIAAALGTGIRVGAAHGNMVVDIGGGSTEVAVISHGGIVKATSIRVAGDSFDSAIVEYIKETRHTHIGIATAEELKKKRGSAHPSTDRGEEQVAGLNLLNGHGVCITVSSGEIREAVSEPFQEIINAIKHALEHTPPELSSDLYDNGIMLTGGGALFKGADKLISEKIGIKVSVAPRPLDAVCNGIARIIETEGLYGDIIRYRER